MSNDQPTSGGLSDETLSARLDGELDVEDAARADEVLARDADARRRYDQFRGVDEALREAYALETVTTPARISALLEEPEEEPGDEREEEGDAAPIDLGRARAARDAARRRPAYFAPAAMAASVALAVGFGVGSFLQIGPQPGADPAARGLQIAGVIAPGDALFAALETTPSAEGVRLSSAGDGSGADSGGAAARPLLTFRGRDGSFCREFEATDAARSIRGVACREPAGWAVKVAAAGPAAPLDAILTDGAGYETASAAEATAIAAYVDEAIAGDPLDEADEAEAMEGGWSPVRDGDG